MLYAAPALAFAAISLGFLSLVLPPRASPFGRLHPPSGALKPGEDPELLRPFMERAVVPFLRAVGRTAGRLTPPKAVVQLEEQLSLAGHPGNLGAAGFLSVTALGSTLLPTLYLLTGAGLGTINSNQVVVALMLSLVAWQLPRTWLKLQVKRRQQEVVRSLPDALDLITVCVEAGLGLDAALARVAEETSGPFASELRQALMESSMGKLRRHALRDMAKRLQVPDLTSFVAALCQADQMGTSLGQVLRVQAEQMRMRRRQRAEQQAMKAPLKMLLPLVGCIFPATFVVILGPAAINLLETFSR